ncbi:hypothetical protein [Halorubrum sp. CGM5_25_10-8B]|uniref:hypothetical protein n=1 Tax=Halorubrum sp. CGM5_25_10-8B TaxID=2518115 RepID=UPI0010F8FA3B|nr:hypothetical protein [Halorubrum sp. CGM5_25_10-8B]
MSVGTLEQVVQRFPGRTGEWAYHVSLGLIGTIGTGVLVSNGLASTHVGAGAAVGLVIATAVAFTGAYLTAAELDKRGER